MNTKLDSGATVAVAGIILLALSACASTGAPGREESYPAKYLAATQEFDSSESSNPAVADDLEDFKRIFLDLKDPNLEEYIHQGYAELLYFNDTLKSMNTRKELSEYLLVTAEHVEYTRVHFSDEFRSGDNYFLLWKMEMGFSVMGKQIESESIGMSQVRLDSQGKVNFHQDFWDSAEGFYRHLPVVGYFVNKSRNQL